MACQKYSNHGGKHICEVHSSEPFEITPEYVARFCRGDSLRCPELQQYKKVRDVQHAETLATLARADIRVASLCRERREVLAKVRDRISLQNSAVSLYAQIPESHTSLPEQLREQVEDVH